MKSKLANKTDSFCEQIYQGILDGYFIPGGRLPSEQKLSESLNLSRTTIRNGLARQIAAGIIEHRGRRTLIHENAVRRIETLERGMRRLIIVEVASNVCNPIIDTMFSLLHNELKAQYSLEVWLSSTNDDVRLNDVTSDDVVICFGVPRGFARKLQERARFVLLVGWSEPGFSYIVPNNYEAGRKVGAHLLQHGHRQVAALFGRSLRDPGFLARYNGVRDVLVKQGGALWDFDGFGTTSELASRVVCDRLEAFVAEHRITAAVSAYDEIALSFEGELLRRGRKLPEYLSLIGFDDQPLSRYVTPSLTTARMPLNKMVQYISTLLTQIPEPGTCVEQLMDFTLLSRESVMDLKK